jgi:hypothetical protein
VGFANSQNPTWDNFDVSNWSTIEINVGIICTCLPTLRLLLVHMFPSFGSSTNRYEYNTKGYSRSKNGRSKSRTAEDDLQYRAGRGQGDNTILYEQSYTVKFSDHDEASLVQMNDLDLKSRGSESKVSVRRDG